MNGDPKSISVFQLDEWLQGESTDPLIIDVREDDELAIASFKFDFIHLPLSKFSDWINHWSEGIPRNQQIVVVCHAGIRSLRFGAWLIDNSWEGRVWNLDGGIDAWSVNIDSDIPRY